MIAGPWLADTTAIAASWAGVLGAITAVVALSLSVGAGNRQRRHEYDAEIRAAEVRGRSSRDEEVSRLRDDLAEARKEASNWRNIALGRGKDGQSP